MFHRDAHEHVLMPPLRVVGRDLQYRPSSKTPVSTVRTGSNLPRRALLDELVVRELGRGYM
jgi:hypothetical protein